MMSGKRFGKAEWSRALTPSPSYRQSSYSHWDSLSFAHASKKTRMSGPGMPAGNRRNNANTGWGQEARLTFEMTNKSLHLSTLSIFHHPPDVPLLFWNSCSRKEGSILTAVLLEPSITSAGPNASWRGLAAMLPLLLGGRGWSGWASYMMDAGTLLPGVGLGQSKCSVLQHLLCKRKKKMQRQKPPEWREGINLGTSKAH